MRRLGRLAPPTTGGRIVTTTFSTFSGGGAGGGGRGRGRGGFVPPPSLNPSQPEPGPTEVASYEGRDPFSSGAGHGRGGPHHPTAPSFPSFISLTPVGRGRGGPHPPPQETLDKKPTFFRQNDAKNPNPGQDKKPTFFRQNDAQNPNPGHDKKPSQLSDPDDESPIPAPHTIPSFSSGGGRGQITRPPPLESGHRPSPEPNRHLRQRKPIGEPPAAASASPAQPKMKREDAIKKAMEVLSRGGPAGAGGGRGGGGGGRGRGVVGMRGRGGRGRGGRGSGRGREIEVEEDFGDPKDMERLEKRLGEEKMKMLEDGLDEMSWRVLPPPMMEEYFNAWDTNNMIEYEPEYLVEFDNPDIDDKPIMSLEEALQKAKPFLMAYEGMQSQEEWEEAVKETMEKLPVMKELIDSYCGPDRVTAKQQQQELERVAKTLPENLPSSVKRFTDRALLSLQSNPGWGFDKKCQFMDKLVWEVSQPYK